MKIRGLIRARDAIQRELDRMSAPSPHSARGRGPGSGEERLLARLLDRGREPRSPAEPGADRSPETAPASAPDARTAALDQRIRSICRDVETACAESGAWPADLPAPSRRAYQWLKSLTEQGALEEHLRLRLRVHEIFSAAEFRTALPRHRRRLSLRLRVEHGSLAYRAVVQRRHLELRLSEAFRAAPDEVLRAILEAALVPGSAGARARVADYCKRSAFRAGITELERLGRPAGAEHREIASRVSGPTDHRRAPPAAGRHHDLHASFARVNARYFDPEIAPPLLRWSARATRRKMGHYEWEGDVVQINRRLDHPSVPEFVIDFVMYHELLHKALGFRVVAGRRRVHTPEFRKRERAFEHYEEARDFLDDLAAHLWRAR